MAVSPIPDNRAVLDTLNAALQALAQSPHSLAGLFVVALLAATLLPLGSEAALLSLVAMRPELFWPAVMVATLGNTLGGAINWWLGWRAHALADRWRARHDPTQPAPMPPIPPRLPDRTLRWLQRHGAAACLLAWLPVVGDPLCGAAGWLRLRFWPCVFYMAVGKLGRYLAIAGALHWAVAAPG